MINASRPNYSETLFLIEELRFITEKLEKNLGSQVPCSIYDKFIATGDAFLNWVEEAEFTIENYPVKYH